MKMRTKTGLVAGAAVLAIAGIGGGVAFAASDHGSTGTIVATTTAATSTTAPSDTAAHPRKHPLLSRAEHAEATVNTKQGPKVVDLQRGSVTSVSPTSVTVRSKDGFTATYAVTSSTKVRKNKQSGAIGEVQNGDRVLVLAVKQGSATTVTRLVDAGPAAH
jgi:hypothetical protein